MSRFVPLCPVLSHFCPVAHPIFGTGHFESGTKRDKTGQNGTKRDQTGPNGAKHGQPKPNSVKQSQAGPNGVTIHGLVGDQPWGGG